MSVLLPPELQREIFEIAMKLNHEDAEVKLNLNLVADHVHFWVDHAFYRVVEISDSDSAAIFLTLVNSKPQNFFATAVKVLLLMSSLRTTEMQIAQILHACRGVESLAFWAPDYNSPLPLLVGKLPLRRLSLEFPNLVNTLGESTLPVWLSGLTHLDLAWELRVKVSDLSGTLQQLTGLTHIALDGRLSQAAHARAVTESCPALQVLLIVEAEEEGEGVFQSGEITKAYSFDHRIVLVFREPPSIARDWVAPYFGLDDMWASAEHVIAERLKKARTKVVE
ncbi:hypothetical protein C8F04DRAFT_522082 [Mycena alexandri]|uniref:Uncharacterized protein n=1 Tax=Mycena alexandri TaxID=1745969 RepID=A0AAD6XH32_9AGAR|nr:hypothetical protein C8F04DRAFT_522082 [Mycena alexandri]